MSPVRATALFNRVGVSPLQGSSCRIWPNPGLHPGLWAKGRAFSPRVERFASFRHPQFLKDRLRLGKAKRKSFGFSLVIAFGLHYLWRR